MVPTRRSLAALAATTTLAVLGGGAADAHADIAFTSPALVGPQQKAYTNDTTPDLGYAGAGAGDTIELHGGDPDSVLGTSLAGSDGRGVVTPDDPLPATSPGSPDGLTIYGGGSVGQGYLDIYVDQVPSLDGVSDGTVAAPDVTFSASQGIPGQDVALYIDDFTVPAATAVADADGAATFTLAQPLAAGAHQAAVSSVDAGGVESTQSARTSFGVTPTAPAFDTGFDGRFFNQVPTVTAGGLDAAATAATLYVDTDDQDAYPSNFRPLATAAPSAGHASFAPASFITPLLNGRRTLYVTQTVGGVETDEQALGGGLDYATLALQTAAPTLAAPAGDLPAFPEFPVTDAPCTPDGELALYVDGVRNGGGDGDLSCATTVGVQRSLAAGQHTAQVSTIDSTGHESAKSNTVTFTVPVQDTPADTTPGGETPTGPQSGGAPTQTTTTTPPVPAPVVTPPVVPAPPKPAADDTDGDGITTTWLVKGKAAAAPAAPKVGVKGTTVTLKLAGAPKGAKKIRLYRALADGTFKLVKTVPAKTGSITDTTGKAGRTYRYKTVAVNAKGQQGKASKAVKAKLKK